MTDVTGKIKSRVHRSFFDLPKEESRQCLGMNDDINLACRIQIGLDSEDDRTSDIDHGSAVIVSTASIEEATARIERAKRSTK
jgi:hypothetical protein